MRKVLFLMFLLLLTGLGAAGVKAQVRIGGNTPPNPAAALDLNAAEGTTTGTKGLALPRVTLSSNTATLDGTTANITGMLVFNTGGSLNTGVYYWNGTNWIRSVASLTGLVDTTMLAPAPSYPSLLVYTQSGWRTAVWGQTTSTFTTGNSSLANYEGPIIDVSKCIFPPIVQWSMPNTTNVAACWAVGASVECRPLQDAAVTVSQYVGCWRVM